MARPAKYSVEKQLKYIDMFLLENEGTIGKQPYAALERFTASRGDRIPADTFRRTPEVSAHIQKLKQGDIAPRQESATVYRTMSYQQVTLACDRGCRNLEAVIKKLEDQSSLASEYYQKYVCLQGELEKTGRELTLARARCADLESRASAREREVKEALATVRQMRRFIDEAITGPVGKALVAEHFGQKGTEVPDYLDKDALARMTKQLEPPEKKDAKGMQDPVPQDEKTPGTGTDTENTGSTLDDNEDFLESLEE